MYVASRLQVFGLSSACPRNHISSISTLIIRLRSDRCSDSWTNKTGRAEGRARDRDSFRLTLIPRETHLEHSWRHSYFRDWKVHGLHSRTKNSCSRGDYVAIRLIRSATCQLVMSDDANVAYVTRGICKAPKIVGACLKSCFFFLLKQYVP